MKIAKFSIVFLAMLQTVFAQEYGTPPEGARTIVVNMAAVGQNIVNNRLGAHTPTGQMYVLLNDLVPMDHPYDEYQQDVVTPVDPSKFAPGKVRLRSYKRPRPITLRANEGDILQVNFHNLLDKTLVPEQKTVGVQVFGLQWLSSENDKQIQPGESHTYRFFCSAEGVFMLMSPNGNSFGPPSQKTLSHNDNGLFGAVNVQPREAEYYRSQVTRKDLRFATMRVNKDFMKLEWSGEEKLNNQPFLDGEKYGLPEGSEIREKQAAATEGEPDILQEPDKQLFKLRFPADQERNTPKVAEVQIEENRFLFAKTGQPLINYDAVYPKSHPRSGLPVLNMLRKIDDKTFELVHSDLTAIITGPNAGRFPYHQNSPSFRENPATPDRRQPYREFTIMYHISLLTEQAFAPFSDKSDPLYYTLQAGIDGFAINYGIAGIGPEIYANRINLGPQGYHKDGVDLKFEEFFLSSWSVGDPAILVDNPANTNTRATKAKYPDDPSNVYHSYMRDHTKFRVLNTGSVAPHVHHQHAHQWLHTPNSDNGHYLDSQMINPGSTYTMEMTYNGSGNRNQTVGDSIFHCHFYPHFAQGMWSLWRVHDVFEEGTKINPDGRPASGARALPDGEIARGTPIPALVPLPSLGMAPMPAKVRLTKNGRRAIVTPEGKDKDGQEVYKNPGFPFFVPGVAGHRAPHPPLDFAWKEDENGEPLRITEANADAFNKVGELDYLDGGLPRHIVLDGKIVREFHTRWDFTKDFAAYDEDGNFLDGGLTAVELPDRGTPIEQAAMEAHATRTHITHQPNGLPGSFILNGLPPAPGAPFASPDVDDNGNSNFEALRYKAAVVQTDVVFNKEGWHYPQQRFITLLEDVKPTISGERPAEPFFFRANTGETIEFWHTNLVPAYYELDDFQIRTPTDIIGQHIHLVKFDVMASDGAGNGFNYEDGTFSPDEVRDRIDAINAEGGLYHFNTALATHVDKKEVKQSKLKITPYKEDYGDILGEAPHGQNWNGAQTTIQRFDTDALLNNEGEDRTLRTVFTHDHFGPSTHQQVGLYGALLVEPSGSNWIDAITGQDFREIAKQNKRTDGGPTSWQAIIETDNSAESYREFALAVADLQLAYQPRSISEEKRPTSVWFSTPKRPNDEKALSKGRFPEHLFKAFQRQGAPLAKDQITVTGEGPWFVQNKLDTFELTVKDDSQFDVRTLTMEKGWADPKYAIWPPTNGNTKGHGNTSNLSLPNPTIISDPGGSGNIGLWVNNYRNEPLDERVKGDPKKGEDKTDPSFAFASIERNKKRLNSQPKVGSSIAKNSKFKYPKKELTPQMQPQDPYTPLLRAYANDKVEVRAIVGAVDSVHSFRLQGNRWLAEPSSPDSGFRDVQGFAISEHFEMIFQLPPGDRDSATPFADFLYTPSTSTQGLVKGSWGLMRSYRDKQDQLAQVSNNPVEQEKNSTRNFYKPPVDATIRKFDINVEAIETPNCKTLQYQVNGKSLPNLVLRANAGDWIEITLTNNLPKDMSDFQSTYSTAEPLNSNQSDNSNYYSSAKAEQYQASSSAGLHSMLLSYDTTKDTGMNIGSNPAQTVASGGEPKKSLWYAGAIDFKGGKRVLTPIEFGGVNLLPSDPMIQQSFGLFGVLVIEPEGSTWSDEDAHSVVAQINDSNQKPLFTEIVVAGSPPAIEATAKAGTEVRFRVLNSANAPAGTTGNGTNVITVQGHDWQEEPYTKDSTVIGNNPESQAMGTQQVTSLESYNLVLPSAGGEHKQAGSYSFFYYPTGTPIGNLTVTPAE